jgi:hypothetical protein
MVLNGGRMPIRIMLTGSLGRTAAGGYGGHAWAILQYILGFRRLGCEVYYVEQRAAKEFVDENGRPVPCAASVNGRHFCSLMDRFGLSGYAALLESHGSSSVGLSLAEVQKLASDINLLVNRSGHVQIASILRKVRQRMYLDVDPGYTQVWQEQYGVDMNLQGHDVYVTVGLNLGAADCPLPTCGIQWHSTLPPVVLSEWITTDLPGAAYTTVADWRGYGSVEWRGVWYGQKADEFMRLMTLPRLVPVPLELCLSIHPDEADLVTLEQHGWRVIAPRHHITTPAMYRDYIFSSRGEFTAVKHGYAAGHTGWFSDRSACYLAAGRPVITQDTGIGAYIPTGTGLLTFTDLDSAVEAVQRVESDYARHALAAAAFAREYLDSDRVLTRLLQLAGL